MGVRVRGAPRTKQGHGVRARVEPGTGSRAGATLKGDAVGPPAPGTFTLPRMGQGVRGCELRRGERGHPGEGPRLQAYLTAGAWRPQGGPLAPLEFGFQTAAAAATGAFKRQVTAGEGRLRGPGFPLGSAPLPQGRGRPHLMAPGPPPPGPVAWRKGLTIQSRRATCRPGVLTWSVGTSVALAASCRGGRTHILPDL